MISTSSSFPSLTAAAMNAELNLLACSAAASAATGLMRAVRSTACLHTQIPTSAFISPPQDQSLKRMELENPSVAQPLTSMTADFEVLPTLFPGTEKKEQYSPSFLPKHDEYNFVPKNRSLRTKLNISPGWINKYDDPSMISSDSSVASSTISASDGIAFSTQGHKPWIVGHRGSIYHELENTKEAFLSSWSQGSDAVELDVFLLKDNTLIVFHGGGTDQNPGDLSDYCILDDNSTTSPLQSNILDMDYNQCQNLAFNPSFEEFPCDRAKIAMGKIPTLEEVLLDAKRLQKHIKIELKGPGTVEPVLDLVDRLDMVNLCSFSSFFLDRVALVRKLRPHVNALTGEHVYKTGALFDQVPEDFVERAIEVGASEVHLRYDTCTVDRIDAIHNAGMGSMAWFRGPIGMRKDTSEKYWDVGNEDEGMYYTVLATGVQQMCINKPDVLAAMYKEEAEAIEMLAA